MDAGICSEDVVQGICRQLFLLQMFGENDGRYYGTNGWISLLIALGDISSKLPLFSMAKCRPFSRIFNDDI